MMCEPDRGRLTACQRTRLLQTASSTSAASDFNWTVLTSPGTLCNASELQSCPESMLLAAKHDRLSTQSQSGTAARGFAEGDWKLIGRLYKRRFRLNGLQLATQTSDAAGERLTGNDSAKRPDGGNDDSVKHESICSDNRLSADKANCFDDILLSACTNHTWITRDTSETMGAITVCTDIKNNWYMWNW